MFEIGSTSHSSTGNKTVILENIEIAGYVDFWLVAPGGHTMGSADGTNQVCIWKSVDNGDDIVGKAFSLRVKEGGVLVTKVEGTFVSSSDYELTINITTANSAYPIYFKAYPA